MSQEDVDVVLASFEAYNAGDLHRMMGFYASDVAVFPDPGVFPESAPLHGLSEWRAWVKEIATAWENPPRYITTEVLDLGNGRVLRRGDWGGVGATSGIEMFSSITGVFTVREGLISRTEYFFDHDKALKAAGLAE
jgi:ketosteroid isomerase-like protein